MTTASRGGLDGLAGAVAAGRAHTVRVCFSDHYGTLRGRRLAAEEFLGAPRRPQAFCDGALIWDVQCEIFEEAAYSNFSTGYPDLHARPDLATLAPCGWVEGEWSVLCDVVDARGAPVFVDPRQALRRVLERIDPTVAVGATLELHVADAPAWQPGAPTPWGTALAAGLLACGLGAVTLQPVPDDALVRVHLGPREPLALADALAVARTAARELGARLGVRVTTMARTSAEQAPARLALRVGWPGAAPVAAQARAEDLALLLAPLPLGYPRPAAAGLTLVGASDANPWLAVAAALAASAEADRAGDGGAGALAPARHYREAIDRLRACAWAASWFDELLLHDTLALADREALLRERQMGAWDFERYEEVG